MALRSAETYPTTSVRPLSHFVVSYAEEQSPADALHLARHHPARTLRDVAAKRAVVDWCRRMDPYPGMGGLIADEAHRILAWLAAAWSDHPDYRPEWSPNG